MRKGATLVVLVAVAGLLLSGCLRASSFDDTDTGEYVGGWVGNGDASLDLAADGTYTAYLLPIQLADPDFWPSPLTATGTWFVNPGAGGQPESVELVIDTTGGLALYPRGSESSRMLVMPTDDSRTDFVMRRRRSGDPKPPPIGENGAPPASPSPAH